MDYRILGSFEVRAGGRLVGLGGEKPRALLAVLLLHRNEVVSADRLIDDLWGESPPETALRTLRAYVSRLRKALARNGRLCVPRNPNAAPDVERGVLLTRGRGYLLRVAPGELDLERFRELAERGRDALAAGNTEEAATVLSEALEIWRGPPLADFAYEPFAQAVIARLEELGLAAVEDRVDADLALGRARELVGELRDLVAGHPLRERLRGQLMLALYRSGRQAEALEAYQEFRRTLSEELGLEHGPGDTAARAGDPRPRPERSILAAAQEGLPRRRRLQPEVRWVGSGSSSPAQAGCGRSVASGARRCWRGRCREWWRDRGADGNPRRFGWCDRRIGRRCPGGGAARDLTVRARCREWGRVGSQLQRRDGLADRRGDTRKGADDRGWDDSGRVSGWRAARCGSPTTTAARCPGSTRPWTGSSRQFP